KDQASPVFVPFLSLSLFRSFHSRSLSSSLSLSCSQSCWGAAHSACSALSSGSPFYSDFGKCLLAFPQSQLPAEAICSCNHRPLQVSPPRNNLEHLSCSCVCVCVTGRGVGGVKCVCSHVSRRCAVECVLVF